MNKKNLAILATGVLIVGSFFWGLFDIVRSDHMLYMMEMAQYDNWTDLVIGNLDFDRDRMISLGDAVLFRPVLYFLLGNETYFFGYNFFLWQLAGIILHLWVIWNLWKLFTVISESIWAFIFAIAGGVLFVSSEMVFWSHINGYMIFVGLMLCCLRYLYLFRYKEREFDLSSAVKYFVCLVVACFTYETANVAAVLFAIYLITTPIKNKRKYNLVIASFAAPFFYTLISYLNLQQHQFSFESKTALSSGGLPPIIMNMIYAVRWWLFSGVFPSETGIQFSDYRINANVAAVQDPFNQISYSSPLFWVGMVIFVTAVSMLVQYWVKNIRLKKDRSFSLLIVCLMAAYTLVICIGRGAGVRTFVETLSVSLYYAYPFWMMLFVFIYSVIFPDKEKKSLLIRQGEVVLIGVVLGWVLINAFFVYAQGYEIKARQQGARDYFVIIDSFVNAFKHEEGFTFAVNGGSGNNYRNYKFHILNDEGVVDETYIFWEVFYPRYYNDVNPKYEIFPNGAN